MRSAEEDELQQIQDKGLWVRKRGGQCSSRKAVLSHLWNRFSYKICSLDFLWTSPIPL